MDRFGTTNSQSFGFGAPTSTRKGGALRFTKIDTSKHRYIDTSASLFTSCSAWRMHGRRLVSSGGGGVVGADVDTERYRRSVGTSTRFQRIPPGLFHSGVAVLEGIQRSDVTSRTHPHPHPPRQPTTPTNTEFPWIPESSVGAQKTLYCAAVSGCRSVTVHSCGPLAS